MKKIEIHELKVFGYIGVLEDEKRNGQEYIVDLKADLDDIFDCNDDLNNTVSYFDLSQDIVNYFQSSKCNLLENATEELCDLILSKYTLINAIEIVIYKTQIDLAASYSKVGISCKKEIVTSYIGLGSNMGDLDAQLDFAIHALKNTQGILQVKESKRYKTAPYGYLAQDDFLNSVAEIRTYLSPSELLEVLHNIETEANRVREIHWGPRTLDLDIELYGHQIVSLSDLCIPHIDIENRRFVLEPLVDINPHAYHPVNNKRAIEMLNELVERETESNEV